MTAASKRILGYAVLAVFAYGIAATLGGVGAAAVSFVVAALIFEGFLVMEARRRLRRDNRSQR